MSTVLALHARPFEVQPRLLQLVVAAQAENYAHRRRCQPTADWIHGKQEDGLRGLNCKWLVDG